MGPTHDKKTSAARPRGEGRRGGSVQVLLAWARRRGNEHWKVESFVIGNALTLGVYYTSSGPPMWRECREGQSAAGSSAAFCFRKKAPGGRRRSRHASEGKTASNEWKEDLVHVLRAGSDDAWHRSTRRLRSKNSKLRLPRKKIKVRLEGPNRTRTKLT